VRKLMNRCIESPPKRGFGYVLDQKV